MTFPMNSGQDCLRAWEAMPSVLQHGASHEQSEWLNEHMAHCDACRAEYVQQGHLQRAMSLPSDISVDASAGLKRLMGRIDAPDLEEVPLRFRSANWLSRALVAVVLIQALGIGALSLKSWSTSGTPLYRTLSQEAVSTPPDALRVVPDATMTLADWNALLRALQLQVVGGPNDVGAYTVAPTSPASAAQHTLQRLRATKGIRLAEPVTVKP